VRTEPAGERGRDGLVEEEPQVSAESGAGSLKRSVKVQAPTGFQTGHCILMPAALIKVDGQLSGLCLTGAYLQAQRQKRRGQMRRLDGQWPEILAQATIFLTAWVAVTGAVLTAWMRAVR
jgi:hypothetical protein